MPENRAGLLALEREAERLGFDRNLLHPDKRLLLHRDAPSCFAWMLAEKSSWFVGMSRGHPTTIEWTHTWTKSNIPTYCYLYNETGLHPVDLATCLNWIEGEGKEYVHVQ